MVISGLAMDFNALDSFGFYELFNQAHLLRYGNYDVDHFVESFVCRHKLFDSCINLSGCWPRQVNSCARIRNGPPP